MSDQIPFHIQEEIMKRIPVKSLIRFRCVSKEWKSLIDSSNFIGAHTLRRHTQLHHLLVSCQDFEEEGKYVCYIDDDTFPHQRSLSSNQIIYPSLVGSSRGLVCLSGCRDPSLENVALLWNPSIRKSVIIDVPDEHANVAFGVCPMTNDPKIVSITQSSWDVPDTSYTCEFMVYTLSSGKWRTLSTNLPTIPIRSFNCSVVTDRFIYWLVDSQTPQLIMSFDVTDECFEAIDLPHSLAHHDSDYLYISKLRESLAMLQYDSNICTVWMMEHGVKTSFKKLFNIVIPSGNGYILGFRKNGIPIMEVTDCDPDDVDKRVKLVVYEPASDHNSILEMTPYGFKVISYMETLLLLGRSDCISY